MRKKRSLIHWLPIPWLATLLSLAAVTVMITLWGVHWLARGPDTVLNFDRVVHSDEARVELDYRLAHFQEWPKWFYSLARVEALSGSLVAKTGETLKFSIDPHKGPSRRFEITAKVTEFTPGSKLSIHLVSETSGKIMRMFSNVDWTVEITPGNDVTGQESAETSSARARFFGRIAPRILMNQIFYPDVISLATQIKPQPVDLVGP